MTCLITGRELSTSIYPSPLLQRDHRLRLLLRTFAPSLAQAYSETESPRSHYPPLALNDLWELWGAVWLAKELRQLGFSGFSSLGGVETVYRCSWRMRKGDVTIELDYEAKPALIDYDRLPPVNERSISTMEWAAKNQELDAERPYLGLEMRCSPDYLLRITTPIRKVLMVGDACLASPQHHGKISDKTEKKQGNTKKKTDNSDGIQDKNSAKPYTVELYRRTIGWADNGEVISCHPLGGFVLFPPPASSWKEFERLPGASDCILLCPHPRGDHEASYRLEQLLARIVPEFVDDSRDLPRPRIDD